MAQQRLIPNNNQVSAWYILGQSYPNSNNVNMVAWAWNADKQRWCDLPQQRFSYSPENMDQSGWEIVEPTTEFIYWVKDIFGRVRTAD